jgi:hypothetical protein
VNEILVRLFQIVLVFFPSPLPVIIRILKSERIAVQHLRLLGEALDMNTSDVIKVICRGRPKGEATMLDTWTPCHLSSYEVCR